MRAKNFMLIALLLGVSLVSSSALTQQQQMEATVSITNICSQNVLVIQVIQLTLNGTPIATQFLFPGQQIKPKETFKFTLKVSTTPNDLTIAGALDGQGFTVKIEQLSLNTPITDREHCMEILVSLPGAVQPPPAKPITSGQSLEQVLGTLQALGIAVSTEGSQTNPKLPNIGDPMLIRVISGSSAQLLFLSAPGTLRAVITWDSPTIDLDLIVIGLPGGFCFQLTPPGVLAEICDRPPSGPVTGVLFAVIIINWSAFPEAYVLSLSP